MFVKEFDIYLPLRGEDICEWCSRRSNHGTADQGNAVCEYHTFHVRLMARNFRLVDCCVNAMADNGRLFQPDRAKIQSLIESEATVNKEEQRGSCR